MDTSQLAQQADEHREVVVFSVTDETYGVDIHQVREIIRVPDVTRVPRTPEFVEGVVNLRGSVIPVLDLRKRFGFEPKNSDNDQRIVVLEMDDQTVGMIVDSVSEVLRINISAIDSPSPYVVSVDSQYIEGIAKVGDSLVILLDVNRVLSAREKDAVAEMAQE